MHARLAPLLTVVALIAAAGCGEGNFVVTNDTYEPRIVVQGFLHPGPGVERIYIWRNFAPNANLQRLDLIPDDTNARIIDEASGRAYPLTFHPTPSGQSLRDYYFEYTGQDLVIEPGKTYTLDVRATIAGQSLHTWASTTVPREGFRIIGVNHEQLPYRPLDARGDPVNFAVTIERNPDSRLYLATVRPVPEAATPDSFVYDNPFTDEDPESVREDLPDFSYHSDWIQNVPLEPGQSGIELFWFYFWFYGEHEITVYATDANYQRFLQTYDEVQEPDGNFHEPSFALEGDGIGVFGSAIADRIRVQVSRQ